MTPVLSPIHGGHVSGTLRSYMKNLSDNWEELRLKVLGLGDSSVRKTHYPSLRKRLAELEQIRSKLQQSEAYLAEAQTLTHTGSFGWYVSSGEIFWSDETYRIFEYDRSVKPTIDTVVQRVHPQDRADFQKVIDGASRGATDFEHTYRLLLPDGRTKHIHALAHALADASGNREFVGAGIDVTSIKRAEEELHKSEFYLAEGQRLGHMGSWAFDPDGFDYWSPELFRMHGLDPAGKAPSVQEYLGFIHPQDQQSIADLMNRLVAEATPFDATKRIVRPDGEVRYIRCVGVPSGDGQSLKKCVGSAIDVTEHELLTQELRRREAYLAEAQRLSHTGSFGWKVASGEILWSDETFRIFQCDPDMNPTVEFVLSRVHPEDRDSVQQEIDRASRDGERFDFEHRLQLPDGSIKFVRVTARPSRDASGNLEFVGAVTDVSEQRHAEAVIKKQEAELREVVDTIPAIVWSTLPDGSNTYVNKRFVEYSGSSAEKMAESGGQALIHPDDLERHAGKWMEAVATGKPLENEVRSRRSDGQYRWQLDRGVPLRDEDGNIVKWYGGTTDIEDRKRAEDKIREQETELAEAQRLSQTGSWAWSPEQDIRYWSEECYRVLSFDPQDGLPRFEDFFQRLHPDDQPGFRELIQTAIREKAEWEADYRIVHPSGTIRDIHVVSHPVLSTSGHLIEFVGTVIDVTERKRAEDERRRSEMELRQMLDFTPQLVAVFGPNRERLFVNRVALDYFGISIDESRQRSIASE